MNQSKRMNESNKYVKYQRREKKLNRSDNSNKLFRFISTNRNLKHIFSCYDLEIFSENKSFICNKTHEHNDFMRINWSVFVLT